MEQSLKILSKDKGFSKLIKKYGKPDLKRGRNTFNAFIRSIIYQQLSGKAAGTILKRFLELFEKEGKKKATYPTPKEMLDMPTARMRAAGISNQKATYLKDLALKFSDGTINHTSLHRMDSNEIIQHLTQVKGVGVWTVQMFLIFTLNRLDILPTGDLGVRKGMRVLYKLPELPNPLKMETLAKPWRVHASVASWYLWKLADEDKR